MPTADMGSLFAALAQTPDPCGRKGRRHSLTALLAGLICVLLGGARGLNAIAQWLRLQSLAFWHALGGKRKLP